MADAWALQFNGVDSFGRFNSQISHSNATSYVLEVDMFIPQLKPQELFSNSGNNRPQFNFIEDRPLNDDRYTLSIFRIDDTGVNTDSLYKVGERFTLRYELTATELIITTPYSQVTLPRGTDNLPINQIGTNRRRTDEFINMLIYSVKEWKEGVLTSEFVNTTSGTETRWDDNVSSNYITLNNFATDGSQWVLYDDGTGGNDITLTIESGTFTKNVSDLSLLKDTLFSLGTEGFNYSGTSITAQLNRRLELNSQNGNYVLSGTPQQLIASKLLKTNAENFNLSKNDLNLKTDRYFNPESDSYLISGIDLGITKEKQSLLVSGSYSLSSSPLDLRVDKVLALNPSDFTITTSDLNLLAGKHLNTGSGSYNYAGTDLNLQLSRNLSLNSVSFTVVGDDLALLYGDVELNDYTILLESGLYAHQAPSLDLLYNKTLNLDSTNLISTYNQIDLYYDRYLTLSTDSYELSGKNIEMLKGITLSIGTTNYSLLGADLNLNYNQLQGYSLSLDVGDYNFTGEDLNLLTKRSIKPVSATYQIVGNDLGYSQSRYLNLTTTGLTITSDALDILYNRILNIDSTIFDVSGIPVFLDYSGFIFVRITKYTAKYKNNDVIGNYNQIPFNTRFKPPSVNSRFLTNT